MLTVSLHIFVAARQSDSQHLPGGTQTGGHDSAAGSGTASTWMASDFRHAQSGRNTGPAEHACLRGGHFLHDVHAVSSNALVGFNIFMYVYAITSLWYMYFYLFFFVF